MRNLTFTLLSLILASAMTFAQAPQAFKYQAVARDANGKILANENISMRVSIIRESPDGDIVYSEIHYAQTTSLGLINLNIGQGEFPTTKFSIVDWSSANHYMQIELDPSGGSNFILMGTSELLSVPYALYALSSGDNDGSSRSDEKEWELDKTTGIMYNGNSGNVGIGTMTPLTILDVNGTITATGGNSGEWNTAYSWGDHSLAGYLTEELDDDPTNEIEIPVGGTSGQVLQTDGNGVLSWNDDGGASEINDLTDGKTLGSGLFLGFGAGANVSGWNNRNVAVGSYSLNANTSGSYNTSIGQASMCFNTSGYGNAANGTIALYTNTTGYFNTAIGYAALYGNKTGNYNTAIGYSVNYGNQEGSNNTIIGYEAGKGPYVHSKSGSVFLGFRAGYYEHGSNKLYIENSNSSSPLIYGEFDNDLLIFNGEVELANGNLASSLKFYEPDGSGTNFTKFQSQAQLVDVTYTLPAADGSNGELLQTDGSGILSWTEDVVGATEINQLTDGRTTGNSIFLGSGAGFNGHTVGGANVAVGIDALYTNFNGGFNTAIGYQALYSNTEGQQNTANGYQALYSNTKGQQNIAIGKRALYSNTEGNFNTANGVVALYSNMTGDYNTAIGYEALYNITTGNSNVAIGLKANYQNQEGSNNTSLGYQAGRGSKGNGNVFLGYQAGAISGGDNKLYIANSEGVALIYGEFDNKLLQVNGTLNIRGEYQFPTTDGTYGQILQTNSLGVLSWNDYIVGALEINELIDGKTIGNSIFLGSGAGANAHLTDHRNVALGDNALNKNYDGLDNIALGSKALFFNNTGGDRNIAMGNMAMYKNFSGNDNIAIGSEALYYNQTGRWNIANGSGALFSNNTGAKNVAIGHNANYFNQAGSNNTIIGYEAGKGTSGHSKSGNVFLGYQAGYSETADNKLYIENSASLTPLIYGEFDNNLLRINGTLYIKNAYHFPTTDGSTGQILQTDGSGTLTWIAADDGPPEINDLTDGKTGGNSVFLGAGAGDNDEGPNNANVAVGVDALNANTLGYGNTANGYQALYNNTTGNFNTANGYHALYNNTTGKNNLTNGIGALYNNTTGNYNIAIGFSANYNNQEGSYNTIIGDHAGLGASLHNKSGNVFLGYRAGYYETGDDKLYIENSFSSTPLIGGDFSADEVYLNGDVGISTSTPTAKLDINGSTGYDQLRMRTKFTPTGSGDSNGNTGDLAWDDDYMYIKTSTGWKRAALGTW